MSDIYSPEHKNPSPARSAKAPYSFVPLPGQVVPANDLPDHDTFANGLSGHFIVRLTTQSATYIRGLLTSKEFRLQEENKDIDGNPTERVVGGRKERIATPFRKLVKNKPDFFNYAGEERPIIPGSSLRGMLRTLFEIVTFSKVQPISDALKMYFRAVAAEANDPLRRPYRSVIGNNASQVRVGYLDQDREGWWIIPAKPPQQVDPDLTKDRYIKVRKDSVSNGSVTVNIPGFVGLDGQGYRVQYYDVKFDVGRSWYINRRGERKTPTTATRIATDSGTHEGTLVATGNMLETSDGSLPSPRMNIYLIPEKSDEQRIPISEQAIEDYQSALTPFQTEMPFDRTSGVLEPGRPVFYISPGRAGDPVIYFGHTPNFRIQHVRGNGESRAVTPRDFVPAALNSENTLDMAEAVFGFVRSPAYRRQQGIAQGDKRASYASRVFVTDARLLGNPPDVFFIAEGDHTLVPKILATPKPTSFQLYLVQTSEMKAQLKHYGSKTPNETIIRGHKLYWHKGRITKIDLEPEADDPGMVDGSVKADSTQHTQIKPLRPDLTFEFRVYFENLNEIELGALAWVLTLPEGHCHKIGMGKPLGMGAVLLHNAELQLADRVARYSALFDGPSWAQPTLRDTTMSDYKKLFEDHVLKTIAPHTSSFVSLPRISALLTMLKYWERTDAWLHETQYMKIHTGQDDDYTRRTVLPNPDGMIGQASPIAGTSHGPSPGKFLATQQPLMTGTVAYYGRAAGGIRSDADGSLARIHKRNLPPGVTRLEEGQKVHYYVVQEADQLNAYVVEVLG